ncbi:MAG: hypothetical protein HY347_05075 [candidate division NC10 bacterium]|nr:hypothetical protein [candidate division NC10 bacterium]
MHHSYLLEPGRWRAQGVLKSPGGVEKRFTGHSEVSREGRSLIRVEAAVQLEGEGQVELRVRYRISLDGARFTFEQHNETLGDMVGFGFMGEKAIVIVYRSAEQRGRYSGFELLYQMADDRYLSIGCLMINGVLNSMTEATLERER